MLQRNEIFIFIVTSVTLGLFNRQPGYADARTVIVTTKNGRISGITGKTIGENKKYVSFRGIPYAKPPVGSLRFKNPEPIDKWTIVYNATDEKNVCIQKGTEIVGSEDCLYLNIYTPEISGIKKAVMVFIHGGGFAFGSCSYNVCGPDYLLDQNVVFACIQYRLGILGFISTGDLVAPGNIGLKDQNLALKWIKNNIGAFGGDSNKITIFGQSAGSSSINYHIQSKLSKGLFHGAIMQSGTSLSSGSLSKKGRIAAFRTGKELNIITTDSQTLINELRKTNASTLISASANVSYQMNYVEANFLDGTFTFIPVLEPPHEGAFVVESSYEILKKGKFPNKVPTIIGYNNLEFGPIFLIQFAAALQKYAIDSSLLPPENMNIKDNATRVIVGNDIKNYYFGSVDPIPITSYKFAQFASDTTFSRPIRRTAKYMSRYTSVYFYRFGYEGNISNPNRTYRGVIHGEELYYIFRIRLSSTPTASDIKMRERMVKLWTNFAKTRNPTPKLKDPLLDNVIWPVTNIIHSNIIFLNIIKNLNLGKNPEELNWRFWVRMYKTYGRPPFYTY